MKNAGGTATIKIVLANHDFRADDLTQANIVYQNAMEPLGHKKENVYMTMNNGFPRFYVKVEALPWVLELQRNDYNKPSESPRE